MTSGYIACVTYEFEISDEIYSIETGDTDGTLFVEEARKNGQEDTHMQGVLVLKGGVWGWDADDPQNFDTYGGDGLADEIAAYVNRNGAPNTEGS